MNRSLMTTIRLSCSCLSWILAASLAVSAPPQDEQKAQDEQTGQDDLDQATTKKLSAKTPDDLEEVVQLCESAMEQGLDAENERFAKQLASSTLLQRATHFTAPILLKRPPDPRWRVLRRIALKDLEKATGYDDGLGEAFLLIARLETLPNGDRQRGLKAADRAAEILQNDKAQLADALIIRAGLREDEQERLSDISAAIEATPDNGDVWQLRAMYFLSRQQFDKAIADFKKMIELDPANPVPRMSVAEIQMNLKQYDQALQTLADLIKLQPESSAAYVMRARVQVAREDASAAMVELNKAIELEPRNITALLIRAQLRQDDGKLDLALQDANRVLQIEPGLPQARIMRSLVLALQGQFAKAIEDLQVVLKANPDDPAVLLQMATYQVLNSQPRAAIKHYSQVLEQDPEQVVALRGRADASLAVGKHADAIADFEKALQAEPDNSNALNNLAWVLATSPDDELRNGKRSIELGTKACKLTQYKQAHILSTLAAGYAETGNFESARKWAAKAVELGEGETKQQLEAELKSYEKEEPWRERQQVKENQPTGPST